MELLTGYIGMIDGVVTFFGATHNMMHIHIGMTIYLVSQIVLRNRRASPLALAIVTTCELVHEAIERLHYGSWRWSDTSSDIVLTLMWPTIITAVGLYRRRRWVMMEKLRREQLQLRSSNRRRRSSREVLA